MTNDLGVEVPYGGAKDCLGVAAVVDQDVVEALLAHGPDEVLRVRHRPPAIGSHHQAYLETRLPQDPRKSDLSLPTMADANMLREGADKSPSLLAMVSLGGAPAGPAIGVHEIHT
jgi:hypothetical protein